MIAPVSINRLYSPCVHNRNKLAEMITKRQHIDCYYHMTTHRDSRIVEHVQYLHELTHAV